MCWKFPAPQASAKRSCGFNSSSCTCNCCVFCVIFIILGKIAWLLFFIKFPYFYSDCLLNLSGDIVIGTTIHFFGQPVIQFIVEIMYACRKAVMTPYDGIINIWCTLILYVYYINIYTCTLKTRYKEYCNYCNDFKLLKKIHLFVFRNRFVLYKQD